MKPIYIPDVSLPDKNSSMMNGLSHTRFEYKCLKPAFKKILNSESQDIIEFVLSFIKKTMLKHSSQQRFTLKDTTRIFLIKGQQIPCIVTDTAQSILNPPKLPLAPKTVLSYQLQLSIQTFLLVWTTRFLECFPIYECSIRSKSTINSTIFHVTTKSINDNNGMEWKIERYSQFR